jgi:hypothetical protein
MNRARRNCGAAMVSIAMQFPSVARVYWGLALQGFKPAQAGAPAIGAPSAIPALARAASMNAAPPSRFAQSRYDPLIEHWAAIGTLGLMRV